MGLIHAGMAQHGTTVFAHEQTKGKGQRDKQWWSRPNENITLSLIVKPFGLSTNELFLLSMTVSIGVQQFFQSYAGEDTSIKWPNDVYWRDRKAGGILIENIIRGQEWKYAVIGIGININQTDFGKFSKAVSLKQITGKTYDPLELSKGLLDFLDKSFTSFTTGADIARQYHQHLYKWKEKVLLKKDNKSFEALVKEVKTDGTLIVQNDKRESSFKAGEIEWL